MKKVIAINSSRRKKNTYNILQQIKARLTEDIQVDIINLSDYQIKECVGCENCIRKGTCHINDDAEALMRKLTEYDGIIIGTPIYMNNISGTLKVFVDRTCRWLHRPELVAKPILFVVTTSASGIGNTLGYLNNIVLQWGAMPSGNISRTVNTLNHPVKESEYNRFVKHIFMDKKSYKPKLNQLIQFQVQKVLAQKILPYDRAYWEEQKWMDRIYFYDANISLGKRIIVSTFYKFLYSKVKKVGD